VVASTVEGAVTKRVFQMRKHNHKRKEKNLHIAVAAAADGDAGMKNDSDTVVNNYYKYVLWDRS
jgi:hypothetical protein